jgi:hypothetical protein
MWGCLHNLFVRIKIVIIHKGYGEKSVVKYFNFSPLYVCCFSFASFLFIMLQYICFCCYFQKLVSEWGFIFVFVVISKNCIIE